MPKRLACGIWFDHHWMVFTQVMPRDDLHIKIGKLDKTILVLCHHNLSSGPSGCSLCLHLRTAYETTKPLINLEQNKSYTGSQKSRFAVALVFVINFRHLGGFHMASLRGQRIDGESTKQGHAAFKTGVSQYNEGGCNDEIWCRGSQQNAVKT